MSSSDRYSALPRAIRSRLHLSSAFWKFLKVYICAVDNLDHGEGTPSPQSDFEAYLQERAKKISQQMRFLRRHGMSFGGYLPWQLEQFLGDTRDYRG